jgi:protein required for attachment to host cells
MAWAPVKIAGARLYDRRESPMKPLKTWIVVADGANARFLAWRGLKSGAVGISGQTFERDSPRTHDLGTDRPGRVHDSTGHARHAIQPRSDRHDEQEKAFLRLVVRRLLEAFESNAFHDVVLIAPPRALGVLRDVLPDQLSKRVILAIDKDLTKHRDEAVSDILRREPVVQGFKSGAETK